MTLTGKTAWVALGAALLVGAAGGTFASGWRKARGLEVEASADAGVRVVVDAGTASACDCAADVVWKTIEVPGKTRYIYGDAGVVEVHTTSTVFVPDVRLTGHAEAISSLENLAEATGSATSRVAEKAEPGLSILWGVGGGVQHGAADGYHGVAGGELGVAWGQSSVKISGGVDPANTQIWHGMLLYGGRF